MKYFFFSVIICFVFNLTASPTDSVGLTKLGKVFVIVHVVDKGEGFLSIARRYNTTQEDIQKLNPTVKKLSIGQKLNIPIVAKTIIADSSKITVNESHANADAKEGMNGKVHIVAQGETIAKIAAKYKISNQQLIRWNNIKNNTITVGQALRISGSTDIKPYETWNQNNSTTIKIDSPRNILSSPEKTIEETGFVNITTDISHPTLRVGTMVLITNPTNQQKLLIHIETNQPLESGSVIGLPAGIIEKLGINVTIPVTIQYNLP